MIEIKTKNKKEKINKKLVGWELVCAVWLIICYIGGFLIGKKIKKIKENS